MKLRRILSFVLAALMMASMILMGTTVSAEESPYTDVKTKRWSFADIMYVTENGLMNGTEPGKFAPAETMTRAMVVTVLYRLQGEPSVNMRTVFTDVSLNTWYSKAVIWAAENDIVNGVGDEKFDPMGTITREQLATIIMRYAPEEYILAEERADITVFDDYNRVHDYSKEALAWANAVGLITGKTETTLAPREGATREQFAAILRRFKEYDAYSYSLAYNEPKAVGTYTEKEYPLVTDADIYVAVDGKDTNDGTFNSPIATFERAKEMVRELKADKTTGSIKVAFKTGVYTAPEMLTFTEEDSGTDKCPVIYCAYGDGEVEFNAGVVLPLEDFEPLNETEKEMFKEEYKDSIKKLDLDKYGVDVTAIDSNTSVFGGGQRLDIARWPNKLASGNDGFTNLYFYVAEDESYIALMPPLVNRLNTYHNIDDMYMFGYYRYDWASADGKVIAYDPETGHITPYAGGYGIYNSQAEYPGHPCPYFYFYNIPDELDRTDEYYIDKKTGTLYAIDPKSDFCISLTGDMVKMENADHISFTELSFSYAKGNAFYARNSDYIEFTGCNFDHIRGAAIDIRGNNIKIYGCEFFDVGMRCVDLVSGDRATLTGGNSVVENCLFDHFGSVQKTNMPAVHVWGCGIRIAHNEMGYSTNSAIAYSEFVQASNDITIEYNYIHDVVTQSSDFGAIYGGRNLAGHGSVIRYNLICNVGNAREGHRSLGIYLDDSMSGQEVYGNIFYNIANHSIFTNGGRENKIHDNIMISNTDEQKYEINLGQGQYEYFKNHTEQFTKPATDKEIFDILELVPFRNEIWVSRFPSLSKYVYDLNDMAPYAEDPYCPINPSFNEVYDNHIIATENRIEGGEIEVFGERVVSYGTRVEPSEVYSTQEDPFFTNPAIGDYSLREDADIIDIPYEKIGRY